MKFILFSISSSLYTKLHMYVCMRAYANAEGNDGANLWEFCSSNLMMMLEMLKKMKMMGTTFAQK